MNIEQEISKLFEERQYELVGRLGIPAQHFLKNNVLYKK